MSTLREAIDNFDLESFLIEHHGQEHQPGEWTLTCPWCHDEKLIVNQRRRTWHCWKCQQFELRWAGSSYKRTAVAGAGGLIQLIMALARCTRGEAELRLLRGNVRRPGELQRVEVEPMSLEPVKPGVALPIPFPPGARAFDQLHPYLNQRGITWADVQRFSLLYCDWGRYRERVIFPVFEGGVLVYWQARALWDGSGREFQKSLNPPKRICPITSADVLFNLDQAVCVGRRHICLTEGPIDAIHAGPDAVCSFGKQLTGVQIGKMLAKRVACVDMLWDADAHADAERTAEQLARLFRVRIVRLPQGDPGDWPREQLSQWRQQAEVVERPSRLARL